MFQINELLGRFKLLQDEWSCVVGRNIFKERSLGGWRINFFLMEWNGFICIFSSFRDPKNFTSAHYICAKKLDSYTLYFGASQYAHTTEALK